jgi:hypothetical protein
MLLFPKVENARFVPAADLMEVYLMKQVEVVEI